MKKFKGGDNMATKTAKKEEYITVTGLIEKRGWTRSMATKLLQNLNCKVVDNPRYRCAAPMTLYYLKDIKRIEKTKKFAQLKEKAEKRKISAKKAVETKIDKTVDIADTFSVTVERIDLADLEEFTLEEKQNWYNYKFFNFLDEEICRNAYSADEETIKRWMVNFIRHNLSDYDEQLEILEGRTGKSKGYWHFKMKLAEEMKRVYPELEKYIDKYMLGTQEDE